MERYKITLVNDVINHSRQEVMIWEDNAANPTSFRNIHFIQDKSGVDILTFTVNADHPMYKSFSVGQDKAVRLYVGKTFYVFFIVFVDTNELIKEKSVTCAAPLVILNWSPFAIRSTTTGSYTYPPNPTGVTVGENLTDVCSEALHVWQEYGPVLSIMFDYNGDLFDYISKKDVRFNSLYSDIKNDILEKSGTAIFRLSSFTNASSVPNMFETYDCRPYEWLRENADIIEIKTAAAITKWNTTEDLESYFTHALVFKEDDNGKVVKSRTFSVRTEAEQRRYGQRYISSATNNDPFSVVSQRTKDAVKATEISSSIIQLNPAAVPDYHDISIYKRLHILLEEIDKNQMFLITKCDRCLDDALRTSIEVEFIEDIVNDSSVFDTAKYGENRFM